MLIINDRYCMSFFPNPILICIVKLAGAERDESSGVFLFPD